MDAMNINNGEMEGRELRKYVAEEVGGYAVEGDPTASNASSLLPLNDDTEDPRASAEKPRKGSKVH